MKLNLNKVSLNAKQNMNKTIFFYIKKIYYNKHYKQTRGSQEPVSFTWL